MASERRVYLILGQTGCGKTTLAKRVRKTYRRVLTLDPHGEYDGTIVDSFTSLLDYFTREGFDPDLDAFNVTCRFTSDVDVEYFFLLAWEIGDCLLCIDEAEAYLDPRNSDEGFMRIIRYGRHAPGGEISMLCIARRAPEIVIDYRAQATIATFRQTEPDDLLKLRAWGFDMKQISALPDHAFTAIHGNVP